MKRTKRFFINTLPTMLLNKATNKNMQTVFARCIAQTAEKLTRKIVTTASVRACTTYTTFLSKTAFVFAETCAKFCKLKTATLKSRRFVLRDAKQNARRNYVKLEFFFVGLQQTDCAIVAAINRFDVARFVVDKQIEIVTKHIHAVGCFQRRHAIHLEFLCFGNFYRF